MTETPSFASLLENFRRRLEEDRALVCRALEGRTAGETVDLDALQSAIHKLAGIAGIFGAGDVSETAAALDVLLDAGCIDSQAEVLLRKLGDEIDAVLREGGLSSPDGA